MHENYIIELTQEKSCCNSQSYWVGLEKLSGRGHFTRSTCLQKNQHNLLWQMKSQGLWYHKGGNLKYLTQNTIIFFIKSYKHFLNTQVPQLLWLEMALFSKKFFVLGMAHEDPSFAQVGLKNSNFQRFQQNFFRTNGFQLNFLILILFPNIPHWKPAKKIKLGVVLGQNVGQIMSIILKKVKKQVILLSFFIFTWGLPFKARSNGCKTT